MAERKLNILLNNSRNILSGYLNLDPFADGNDNRVKTNIRDLGEYIDNSECSEIRAEDILSHFSANLVEDMIQNWVDKLRKDGIICIIETDLRLVSKCIINDVLDLNTANMLLFGSQTSEIHFKKVIFDISSMEKILKSKGLKIIEKSLDKFHFIIKAQRID